MIYIKTKNSKKIQGFSSFPFMTFFCLSLKVAREGIIAYLTNSNHGSHNFLIIEKTCYSKFLN